MSDRRNDNDSSFGWIYLVALGCAISLATYGSFWAFASDHGSLEYRRSISGTSLIILGVGLVSAVISLVLLFKKSCWLINKFNKPIFVVTVVFLAIMFVTMFGVWISRCGLYL